MKLKAQSILEYVVLLGIVGLALGTMGLYFRRSIQSVIKIAADELGSQEDTEEESLYTRTIPESNITTVTTGQETLNIGTGGQDRSWDTTQTASGWANYTTERGE